MFNFTVLTHLYTSFMEVTNFVNFVNEFGPSVTMFSLGLWGTYKLIILLIGLVNKTNSKVEKAESRKDDANDRTIQLLLDALDKRDTCKQKQHDEAAEYRKQVIYKCNNYAKEILLECGADSVSIYDYCNGTQSLSGIPFLHFRTIAEKEDIKLRKTMYSEKLDINTLGTFLLDLEKKQMITIKNIKKEEDIYPELSYFMRLNKKHKGVFANLVGTDSSLGYISVMFNHNKKVDYNEVNRVLYNYVQKISNLLDYSNLIS